MVEPGSTEVPVAGLFVLITVKSGTGLVTVEEHWTVTVWSPTVAGPGLQIPVVMAAVLTTSAVSVADSLALKVTVAESPGARLTAKVQVDPLGLDRKSVV